ncbi:c-type cytochrome (plasmid) [Bradyrhizobium sp. PMVTL-01]|uniref:c-type cytochrome n=1 Tax=Bradyrhizobium sp. PMVTL-01 TaxID=3434999 RepID=UPI003F723363
MGLLLATIGVSCSGAEEAAAQSGEALYQQRCASCHEGGLARTPDRNALRQLSDQRIGFQIAYGLMSAQGRDLSKDQIGAITRYLKGTAPAPALQLPDSRSRDDGPKLADAALPRWNGWVVDIRQHRFQPADNAQLAADEVPRLRLRWAFGFPGDVRAFAQPTVWGGRLFVGSASTGCQRMADLADGKRALIAGQKSGMVHTFDPDHAGAIVWQRRVGQGSSLGDVQWGMAVDDENVYVAVSDVGLESVASGAPRAQKTIMGGELKMDPREGGGLFALKLATGEVVWHTPHPGCNDKPGCSPAQSAAVTAIPGVVFSGGLDGHLRAYVAKTGEIIWDVDTIQDYTTVNGAAAHGGSLDGPGSLRQFGLHQLRHAGQRSARVLGRWEVGENARLIGA